MKSFVHLAVAAAAAVTTVSAAHADTTVVNSAPATGWIYGTGNNYSPANTVVDTGSDGSQLYSRWHIPYSSAAPASVAQAPASDSNGVYSFALGTPKISFDWGITAPTANTLAIWEATASLTITNLGTSASYSYNPFYPGNDDYFSGATAQNSEQLAYFPAVGFNPTVNDTYQVTLAAGGHTVISYAQIGSGVSAVPEPATWTVMIGGFALIGMAMRGRKVLAAA